ncbi:unnamed protein product [Rotaria sp. Silwood2]|nr:unnamed protein product [Rotaria sp. Silwood2]CAF4512085.1 unnamed protein product [Rotaria sp. Silwood2]CAF4782451.1 unnamed protein product [Rotaria sp. Silwood2]
MILYHGTSKVISNRLYLSDLSLKRTSSRSTTTTASNYTKLVDTQREKLLKQFGSSGLVVLDLVTYVPVGSAISIDNYFASTKLIKKLTQLRYRVTSTLRSNRTEKCPISTEKEFAEKKRGSNHTGIKPTTTLQCWNKEKQLKVDTIAPQIINQYNKFM